MLHPPFFQDLRDTIGFTPQKSNIDTQNDVFFSKGNGTLETWRHFGAIYVSFKMVVVSFFLFSPLLGEDEPILTNVFSNGLKPPTSKDGEKKTWNIFATQSYPSVHARWPASPDITEATRFGKTKTLGSCCEWFLFVLLDVVFVVVFVFVVVVAVGGGGGG